MKIDFSLLVQKDIDGKIVIDSQLTKTVANALWLHAKNLDLVEIAMAINKGEIVDLSKNELVELKVAIKDPRNQVFAFAQKQIFDFIEKVQTKEKEKKN